MTTTRSRWFFRAGVALLGSLALMLVGVTRDLAAQNTIHTNGFAGRTPSWVRGEENVRAEEKSHAITEESAHNGPTSERIQITTQTPARDAAFANYYYSTPPAPVGEELRASVFVKSDRRGIQLSARVVLPKEKNPLQPDEALTVILMGETTKQFRRWDRLSIPRPVELLRDAQQKLRLELKRDIDLSGAYIDRLILNLYTGPGPIDVFIDDLEIGPVLPQVAPPPQSAARKDLPTSGEPIGTRANPRDDKGVSVRLENNKLKVGGQPFFMRAIRYSGTPLKVLHDVGLNTVWFDVNTPNATVEEAVNSGLWIVPDLPLAMSENPSVAELPDGGASGGAGMLTSRDNSDLSTSRDAQGLVTAITRFTARDGVLFWNLGGARTAEQFSLVSRTAQAVQRADPSRPRGADVWDGLASYSGQLDMIGTHRTPLLTSMEPLQYRNWLSQKRTLTMRNAPNKYMWTWIQTHIPEATSRVLYDRGTEGGYSEPVGPQPEQIRTMTWMALASGYQGIGYWSDRFLANSHQGRDRLLQLAILNQEISMLEPLLVSQQESPLWIETSDYRVKAAVLRTGKGLLVLPVWTGLPKGPVNRLGDVRYDGAQYVAPAGTLKELTIVVPGVPDGTEPWSISAAEVRSLQQGCERVQNGVKIRIPQFDMTAAIVFTDDYAGMVSKWQTRARQTAPMVSMWAMDLATIQFEKVSKIHEELLEVAPPVVDALGLLTESAKRLKDARQAARDSNPTLAYQEAMRSMQALRIVMRSHWENAVRSLDIPSASVYAVSFYTLPRHWKLAAEVKSRQPGANLLRDGDFESVAKNPEFLAIAKRGDEVREALRDKDKAKLVSLSKEKVATGVSVDLLKGWTVQSVTLDPVKMEAKLIPASGARAPEPTATPEPRRKPDFAPSSTKFPTEISPLPVPELGDAVLQLSVEAKPVVTASKKVLPAPEALERTFLAVNSPVVKLPPGTLVKISGWVKVPGVTATADGVLFYDSSAGESFGVRSLGHGWQEYRLYRRVPASGTIWLTVAITGIGTAQFDDLKIEVMQ